MTKSYQAMKLNTNGKSFLVVFRIGEHNPYCLYEVFYGPDKNGAFGKHRNLIVRYANMASVLYHLLQDPAYHAALWKDVF